MDPVTIGTAIGVAKAAVSTAKSVQELSHSLQEIWNAESNYHTNKTTKKKEPVKATSRMQQILRMRAGESEEAYGDDTSIANVATSVLQEEENKRLLKDLSIEIDHKWGKGTWDKIRNERSKRLKANIEAKRKARLESQLKKEEDDAFFKKIIMESGKGIILVLIITGLIYGLIWAKNTDKSNRFTTNNIEIIKTWNLV